MSSWGLFCARIATTVSIARSRREGGRRRCGVLIASARPDSPQSRAATAETEATVESRSATPQERDVTTKSATVVKSPVQNSREPRNTG